MIDNYEMFTRKAISSIETAIESASSMGHTYVGTEHIILGFLQEDGNVAAAYPKKDVSAEMQGIVTKIDAEKATVTLTNGLTLRDISIAKDVKTDVMGRLVTVSQSGEKAD